jgi:hypothetical protein
MDGIPRKRKMSVGKDGVTEDKLYTNLLKINELFNF